MEWVERIDMVLQFSPAVCWGCGLLYGVPLLRLLTFPVRTGARWFMPLNRRLGQWEQTVAWCRDTLGVVFLFLLFVWSGFRGVANQTSDMLSPLLVSAGLLVLTMLHHRSKRRAEYQLLEFVRTAAPMHPQEFFDHFFCTMGGVRHRLPAAPTTCIDPTAVDFRTEKKTWFPLLLGVWSTIRIMRFGLLAYRWRGEGFLRDIAKPFALIWGARLLQVARGALVVEGKEHLKERSNYHFYVSNHTSLFDFVVLPLAVGIVPRFLLARDHFIDNPMLYRVLGIGRVTEALGMVFVNRKNPSRANARAVISQAIERMIDERLPIALYPQGTRSRLMTTVNGERSGAGYYTVGKLDRLQQEGAYLKKGAAYLGIDGALELSKRGIHEAVHIIPLGVLGAAITCPRKSLQLKLGTTIRVRIGAPIAITAEMVQGMKQPVGDALPSGSYREGVQELLRRIDRELRSLLRIHGELEGRLLEEVRSRGDENLFEEVSVALLAWRGEDTLVHSILDYIYACRPESWRPFLGQLVHLLTNHAPREALVELRGKVAKVLCQS